VIAALIAALLVLGLAGPAAAAPRWAPAYTVLADIAADYDVAVDGRGSVLFAAATRFSPQGPRLRVRERTPGGRYRPPQTFAVAGHSVGSLELAAGPRGHAVLTWQQNERLVPGQREPRVSYHLLDREPGGRFAGPPRRMPEPLTRVVGVDAAGRALLVGADSGGVVWIGRHVDGRFTDVAPISGGSRLLRGLAAALGPDGRTAVAWIDTLERTSERQYTLRARLARPGGPLGEPQEVAQVTLSGFTDAGGLGDLELTIDPSGRVLLALESGGFGEAWHLERDVLVAAAGTTGPFEGVRLAAAAAAGDGTPKPALDGRGGATVLWQFHGGRGGICGRGVRGAAAGPGGDFGPVRTLSPLCAPYDNYFDAPALAADSRGTAVGAWSRRDRSGFRCPRPVAVVRAPGRAFSALRILARSCDAYYVDVAAGGAGTTAVTWRTAKLSSRGALRTAVRLDR
jgi:hypothetical protein